MPILPTGTVTFLFTDIEGSTKLAQGFPGTWEALRKRHNAILQTAIDSNHGYTFQIIGDAFCAAFSTAGEALRAAVNLQMGLFAEDWGDTPVKVRVGIHTGKAEIQDSGAYIGYAALSRVQRIMSAGHGGQTLISQTTQYLVLDELPPEVSLRDMGERRLKDLIHPEHIYQVNLPNLPVDFPALKTLDVQLNNLPMQMTSFIGREREIAAVVGLLRNPVVHLVTLSGAGGTGKTRLALQVAADLIDEYEHGVWFVDLAPITDPDLLLPTIASTLKVKSPAGTPIAQTLNDYLAGKNLLLVLDNFEQIVSAAPAISGLMNVAPRVKVLVSSREVLRLRGEHSYPVPPLGLPVSRRRQTAAVLAQYEAIALFIQRARAANPSFDLDDENAPIVSEICLKLDGLPLAIELAAARSRLLKPAVMLEKLKSRLNVLTGGARDLPHRQQTIRAAIDWSYDLLDEPEKVLFARLGIFIGGWTLESAQAVCSEGLSLDVLTGLESLLDKSLIRTFEGKSGETRFSMLETIREYASEKLSQSGELPTIQQMHVDFMEKLLQHIYDAEHGPEEETWHVKLDDDFDNLRSVVEWALAHQLPSLIFKAGSLYIYWDQRANYRDPLDWLERGLAFEYNGPPIERAKALRAISGLLAETGNLQRAQEYQEASLAIFREMGDTEWIAYSLGSLGIIAWKDKEFEKARQLTKQVLEVSPDLNSWAKAVTLMNLGSLAMIAGDYQESLDYFTQARETCVRIGSESGLSYTDWFFGKLALAQRKLDEAEAHIQNSLKASWLKASPLIERSTRGYLGYIQLLRGNRKEAQRILNDAIEASLECVDHNSVLPGETGDGWYLFDGKARLELGDGRAARAAQLFGAAWTQRETGGNFLSEAERPDYEARIAEARLALGEAAFEAAFQKGRAMILKDAIAFAVSEFKT